MKTMTVNNGQKIILDDEDYEWYNNGKWICSQGYAQWTVYDAHAKKQRTVLMHRLITAAYEDEEVDHINGNRFDNRKENLRICFHKQNMQNRSKSIANTSNYTGVYKVLKRWRAMICVNGTTTHLGMFDTAVEASRAYQEAAKKLRGEYARAIDC